MEVHVMWVFFNYFRWKDIAERLGLNNYVSSIDRNYSYRCCAGFFCAWKNSNKKVSDS